MRFENYAVRRLENKANNGQMSIETSPATYGGIVKTSLVYGITTLIAAIVSYVIMTQSVLNQNVEMLSTMLLIAFGAALPMFIVSLVIAFAPSTVKVLGIVYTLLQGVLLGTLVMIVDLAFPGVSIAAVLGTGIVFVIAVALNKLLEVRVSSKLMKGVIISFVSITVLAAIIGILAAFEIVSFGVYWWVELLVSAVCVIMATIMLLGDLQSADNMVACGVDSKYEWNVAFAIVTTLIYIYIEILELLIRLAAIFGRSRD